MKLSSLILFRYAADNYYLELKAVKKHHVGKNYTKISM